AVPRDFANRLPAVQRALYLLFNEGYHGASPKAAVRTELCHQAMRLAAVLLDPSLGATPARYALSALMCFEAARLPGRTDLSGNLISFSDQDRSLWDQTLVHDGLKLLELSATGSELTAYHLEAAIARLYSTARRATETNWDAIVSLYDTLMTTSPSP